MRNPGIARGGGTTGARLMDKPEPPVPGQFGVTAADVASIPDWANSDKLRVRCTLGLVLANEIWNAATLSPQDWLQHWGGYLVAGVGIAIYSAIPAMLAAWLICWLLDRALRIIWPRYARLSRFRNAEQIYRKQLWESESRLARRREQFWRSLDGISFERELGRLFARMGYAVSATPRTGDGGVDLVLERGGKRTVVQCKAHVSKVGISTARELIASMIDFRAHSGIIAAKSGVTKPVLEYIRGKNIEIYDLREIINLQRKYE